MEFVTKKLKTASGRRVDAHFVVDGDSCPACAGKGTRTQIRTVSGRTLFGERTERTVRETVACEDCFGTGKEHRQVFRHDCIECKGKKHVFEWRPTGPDARVEKKVICPRCRGLGYSEMVTAKPLRREKFNHVSRWSDDYFKRLP